MRKNEWECEKGMVGGESERVDGGEWREERER